MWKHVETCFSTLMMLCKDFVPDIPGNHLQSSSLDGFYTTLPWTHLFGGKRSPGSISISINGWLCTFPCKESSYSFSCCGARDQCGGCSKVKGGKCVQCASGFVKLGPLEIWVCPLMLYKTFRTSCLRSDWSSQNQYQNHKGTKANNMMLFVSCGCLRKQKIPILNKSKCFICDDVPGWTDMYGRTCEELSVSGWDTPLKTHIWNRHSTARTMQRCAMAVGQLHQSTKPFKAFGPVRRVAFVAVVASFPHQCLDLHMSATVSRIVRHLEDCRITISWCIMHYVLLGTAETAVYGESEQCSKANECGRFSHFNHIGLLTSTGGLRWKCHYPCRCCITGSQLTPRPIPSLRRTWKWAPAISLLPA